MRQKLYVVLLTIALFLGLASLALADDPAATITCPPDTTARCTVQPNDPLTQIPNSLPGPDETGWATAEDAGGNPLQVAYTDELTPGVCPAPSILIRTWVALDAQGNAIPGVSCEQRITLVDNEGPVVWLPHPFYVMVPAGMPTDPDHTGWAMALDNCDPDPQEYYADEPHLDACNGTGYIIRRWWAIDACGNMSPAVETEYIILTDQIEPRLTCPPDVTVECDASLNPSNTGYPLIDDIDCRPLVVYFDVALPGACPGTKLIYRIWAARDHAGNGWNNWDEVAWVDDPTRLDIALPEWLCIQVITVVDTTGPAINVVGIEDQACYTSAPSPIVSAVDNCDPNAATSLEWGIRPGDESCAYELWAYAVDCMGNETNLLYEYFVDNVAPQVTITAPAEAVCYTSANLPALDYIATDNCDPQPEVVVTGYSAEQGHHTATVTVTDCAGNSSSASVFYIVDNTAPTGEITTPANGAHVRGIATIDGWYADYNAFEVDLLINGVQVAAGLPYEWDTTQLLDGPYTIALQMVDCAGNESFVENLVTVDNTVPQLPVTLAADAPAIAGPGTDGELTLQGMAEDNSLNQMWIRRPGQTEFALDGPFTADECGHWTYVFIIGEPGVYTFKVGSHDQAGNWAWGEGFELNLNPGMSYETIKLQQGIQIGPNPSDRYWGNGTTWIDEWAPNQGYGTDGHLRVRYGAERSALLYFHLVGVIPDGAQVELATLGLYSTQKSNINPMQVELYKMKQDWTGGASYNDAGSAIAWDAPGANGAADRELVAGDSAWVTDDQAWYGFTVTDWVAEWATDTGIHNKGMLLKGTADISVEYNFAGSNYIDQCRRPVLYVVISTGTPQLLLAQ